MAAVIIPRLVRGRLYFEVGPVHFATFAEAASAWVAAQAHRLDPRGWRMNVTRNITGEIAEVQVLAAGLREAASVCSLSQVALKARLVVAADALLTMATLAGRALDRIELLQLELAAAIAGRDEAIRQLGIVREYEETSRQGGAS